MADSQTVTPEEREREQANRRAQRGLRTDLSAAPAESSLPDSGLDTAEQHIARRENDQHEQSLRSVAQTAGTTAQAAGTATEVGGATVQGAGALTQATGQGITAAGRGVTTGGQAIMRAGVGLSATGAGAIAGVPLAAVGGAIAGAGGIATGAGQATSAAGRGMEAGGQAARSTGFAMRSAGGEAARLGSVLPTSLPTPGSAGGGMPGLQTAPAATASGISNLAQQAAAQAARLPGVGGAIGGVAGKAADFSQDLLEIVGTSITVIGLLYAIPKLHHRLLWGNLLKGQYLPAKPMAAPELWVPLAVLIDLILFGALMLLIFLVYLIINPCDVVPELVPETYKTIATKACPDWLITIILNKLF